MSYSDQASVESYLGRDLTDEEQAMFDLLVSGASDLIDTYTGRTFETGRPNAATTTDNTVGDKSSNPFQVFDGGDVELFFDQPLQTDTTIKGSNNNPLVIAPYIGYTDLDTGVFNTIDPTDYIFYPHNSKVKTSVMRNLGIFPYGNQNIYVYGTFDDYLTVPDGIKTATTIMVADIISLPDGISQESIEGYSRTFSGQSNPTIQQILDAYRRVIL